MHAKYGSHALLVIHLHGIKNHAIKLVLLKTKRLIAVTLTFYRDVTLILRILYRVVNL